MNMPGNAHEPVSTAHVYASVAARLDPDEAARSLWLKLEQEMVAGGVPAAITYLNARFKELGHRVTKALPQGEQG